MKLGITGTRKGATIEQKTAFVKFLSKEEPTEIHHGGCKGVDTELSQLSIYVTPDLFLISHLPEKKESKYYLKRNKYIVDHSDYLLAFPYSAEVLRSGTWATIRYARKVGKKGKIIYPNGSEEVI